MEGTSVGAAFSADLGQRLKAAAEDSNRKLAAGRERICKVGA